MNENEIKCASVAQIQLILQYEEDAAKAWEAIKTRIETDKELLK